MLYKPSSLKRPKRLALGVRLEDIFAVGLVKSTPRKTTLCHFESGTIDRFFSVALGKGCCRVHRPHSKNKLARSYQVELLSYLICKRKFVYLLISLPIKQYFLTWLLFFLLQTPCRQKPCGDNGDCFPDFRLNTYSCKCHPGFAGIYCERRGNK